MNFEETNGIQTGVGVKLVIYGQEGVGKTSLAAQLPGAVFLDCEGSTSKMNVHRHLRLGGTPCHYPAVQQASGQRHRGV